MCRTTTVTPPTSFGESCPFVLFIIEIMFFMMKLRIIPYFFGHKTEIFSFQNNPKGVDQSYKTDLGLLGLFWKGKTHTCSIAKFHRTGLDICSNSRKEKTCLIAE